MLKMQGILDILVQRVILHFVIECVVMKIN